MTLAEHTIRVAPYILIPHNLCADVRDNPIAVGVYALVARLYFVAHTPIPLSAGDLERFDPQISYGQARRALDRLTESGWLIGSALGRKNAYLPTWGMIQGRSRPWNIAAEKLGRPPHVRCEKLSSERLDQIAYLTPHPRLPAVIRQGVSTDSLAEIGLRLLTALQLAPGATIKASSTAVELVCPAEPIDQLIPQLIGSNATQEAGFEASVSHSTPLVSPTASIPWTPGHEQTNQQASLHETAEALAAKASTSVLDQLALALHLNLNTTVAQGHLTLNSRRLIAAGEWIELDDLQQEHGIERLLIWQARACRRRDPIVQITPDYYRACALRDLVDGLPAGPYQAHEEAHDADALSASALDAPDAVQRALPTGQVAEQLRTLGITVLRGLDTLDPDLVSQWVLASTHPDWAAIWDDPGGAARALLLRGQSPPPANVISRRAAARKRNEPVDWANQVALSAGIARLGDDLDGLALEGADSDIPALDGYYGAASLGEGAVANPAEQIAEQLRMALRLHAPTRPAFQAIERLMIDLASDHVLIVPGRPEDLPLLRNLLPVMQRALDGYAILLR